MNKELLRNAFELNLIQFKVIINEILSFKKINSKDLPEEESLKQKSEVLLNACCALTNPDSNVFNYDKVFKSGRNK